MSTQPNNDIYFERRITTLEMQFERIDEKLDELIVSQSYLATKHDLNFEIVKLYNKIDGVCQKLDNKIDISFSTLDTKIETIYIKLDNKINNVTNKVIWKLGSIIIVWITIYPFILQYFSHK